MWEVATGETMASWQRPGNAAKECHVTPCDDAIFLWSNKDAEPHLWKWRKEPDRAMILKGHAMHHQVIGCHMMDGNRRALTWENERGVVIVWDLTMEFGTAVGRKLANEASGGCRVERVGHCTGGDPTRTVMSCQPCS